MWGEMNASSSECVQAKGPGLVCDAAVVVGSESVLQRNTNRVQYRFAQRGASCSLPSHQGTHSISTRSIVLWC